MTLPIIIAVFPYYLQRKRLQYLLLLNINVV